jgi:PadR family transcriptional regulator PadR
MAAGCKAQLASDYERWGKMVATIEGIMTANRGGA